MIPGQAEHWKMRQPHLLNLLRFIIHEKHAEDRDSRENEEHRAFKHISAHTASIGTVFMCS